MAERRIAVIGHPLAAEENRRAFAGWRDHRVALILPRSWRSPGLRHRYAAPDQPDQPAEEARGPGSPSLHALRVIGSGRNSLFTWVGLGRALDRLRPDLVYCWEEPWCLSTRQAAAHARRLGIPFVFYTAENRPKRLPWPFARLLRRTFAEAAGCIAPTAEIAARARDWGYPGPIAEVPLWTSPRKMLPADPSFRLLAYVGRLIPLKRVDLVVRALAQLPGFGLRIVGDGPERGRLAALARDCGVAERVEFAGHVPNHGLEEALRGSSLLVLPTASDARRAEQFGKAALEGAAMGLPVLTSRGGHLAALAALFPTIEARDFAAPEDLAAAVRDIHDRYPSRPALDAAAARANGEFGPEAAGRRLEDFLGGLGRGP